MLPDDDLVAKAGRMIRIFKHLGIVVGLTALTQLGGVAWLIALAFGRRWLVFGLAYAALGGAALFIAPLFGRAPIPCFSDAPFKMQSPFYCALNRQYAAPELIGRVANLAAQMDTEFPGTKTLVLDAGFPFLNGMPLLPHLSHNDGRKLDLAFYYRDAGGYLAGQTRSPIGYFAFEDGPTECTDLALTLRWDLAWLQPLWRDLRLDEDRMRAVLRHLTADPKIGKLFIEPHLKARFWAGGQGGDKIRFQGCRAARHDDHIHIQL